MDTATDRHDLPPEVTPDRLQRLEEWAVRHAKTIYDLWVEDGEPADSPEGRKALTAVYVSMLCRDIPEWMPLREAISVARTRMVFAPETVGADELRNALRTVETAHKEDIAEVMAVQLGISVEAMSRYDNLFDAFLPDPATADETALYRYYDGDDRLLYIGIAGSPSARDYQHTRLSRWHQFSVRREVEWLATRDEARVAERAAIKTEDPLFNLTHSSPARKRAAMAYLYDRLDEAKAS